MSDAAQLARIAALVGDPARANMLACLMSGRALTAGELATAARVTPQTASEHLGKLVDAGVLGPAKQQGRHRYYALASAQVAAMLEGIMVVAGGPEPRLGNWRGSEALRTARTCYNHIAGRLGVGLADALRARGHLLLDQDGGEVTPSGIVFLRSFGVDAHPDRDRAFCRPCLDWSERRQHLAGRIGTAIAARCFELAWVARQPGGRALTVTHAGRTGFAAQFGIVLPAPQAAPARAA